MSNRITQLIGKDTMMTRRSWWLVNRVIGPILVILGTWVWGYFAMEHFKPLLL